MEKFKIVNIMLIIVLIINVVLPVISAATYENKVVNSVEEIKKDQEENEKTETVEENNIDNVTDKTQDTENKENIDNTDDIENIEKKEIETEVLNYEQQFENFKSNKMQVVYMSYNKGKGWTEPVTDNTISGSVGENGTIEALKIKLVNSPLNAKIKYKTYNKNMGWQEIVSDGQTSGIIKDNSEIYGLKIELENMDEYSIQYRVHMANVGWQEWKNDGSLAGDINKTNKIEAIEIRIISKISKVTSIKYTSYVGNIGWQEEVKNGQTTGTTGQDGNIKGIKIDIENGNIEGKIKYQVYMSNKGWQDWKEDGEIAGELKNNEQIEAIKIDIEGIDDYDLIYRAHVSNIGWQNWVNNGEIAGTTNKHFKIEALEIKLKPKETRKELEVQYSSHVQDYGWEKDFSKKNGETSGTVGENKKVEAIKIKLLNNNSKENINYSVYVEGQGWKNVSSNGEISGTVGKNLKLFGLKINLVNIDNYSVMYRIHVQDIGWKDWVCDGEETETIDEQKKIEAIEVKLVPKVNENINVVYSSHVQDYGWEPNYSKSNGQTSGTIGKNLKVEAMKINLSGDVKDIQIRYRSYVENQGWQDWKKNGEITGTTGKNLKLYGIKIELVNNDEYSIQYRVHIQDKGWTNWVIDGETAGEPANSLKIESIQIRLIKKTNIYLNGITYSSYIENKGWEEENLHQNGEISGSTGQNLKMLGLKIQLKNPEEKQSVKYKIHVQDYGWLDWVSDGEEIGKIAQGNKIEAIQIKLENMDGYTVEYRTHVQDIGWQEWMIDGETAGTTGKNLKVEAIQIRIVPKYKRQYKGIDVSKHNYDIDWSKVKNDGIDFAIVRAGFRGYGTEGTLNEDPYFVDNMKGAIENNIKVGVYFYSQAINAQEAIDEAEMTIRLIQQYGFSNYIKYPIVIDYESSSGRGDKISKQQRTDVIKIFCQRIIQAGYVPMIYSSKNWLVNEIDMQQLSEYDVWLAHYTNDYINKPSDYQGKYNIWQYTSTGKVSGIDTNVDLNISYKNY